VSFLTGIAWVLLMLMLLVVIVGQLVQQLT
jgi:hypothetical protein